MEFKFFRNIVSFFQTLNMEMDASDRLFKEKTGFNLKYERNTFKDWQKSRDAYRTLFGTPEERSKSNMTLEDANKLMGKGPYSEKKK